MNTSPRSVLLLTPTTSYRTDDFLAAAAGLGIDVQLATDRCHALGFSEEAAGSLAVELRSPQAAVAALQQRHQKRPFCAIVPVDDATTVVAAQAAAALGLPHTPVAAVAAARDKRLLRQHLSRAGVAQPMFQTVHLDAGENQRLAAVARLGGFPCVLKPVILSASQGVIRADDPAGLHAAHLRIARLLRRPDIAGVHQDAAQALLYESFLPGAEVAVEGLLFDGRLEVLAVFDKPDPLDGPFFEETLYVTPSRLPAPVLRAIDETTAAAAAALGLREGPVHAELRLPPPDLLPHVIEVAARSIGGLCSRTLRFGTGRSLEELILLHATGRPVAQKEIRRERAAAGVMMLPIPRAGVLRAIGGVEQARAVPGLVEVTVTARPGDELVPLPEGGAYLGFLFARGDSPGQVEAALRAGQRLLRFDVAATLPVGA